MKILTETFHLISIGKTKERSTRQPSAQAQAPLVSYHKNKQIFRLFIEKTCLFIMKILTETCHLISVGKTKERSTRRPSAQAQNPG